MPLLRAPWRCPQAVGGRPAKVSVGWGRIVWTPDALRFQRGR